MQIVTSDLDRPESDYAWACSARSNKCSAVTVAMPCFSNPTKDHNQIAMSELLHLSNGDMEILWVCH